jgi:hypothetical protein
MAEKIDAQMRAPRVVEPGGDGNKPLPTIAHVGLDILGLVPVIGDSVDVFHAGLYLREGNTTDAALTGASAVPFVGIGATIGKWGNMIADAFRAGKDVEKAADVADSAKVLDNVPDSAVRGAVADANFAQPVIRSDRAFSPEGQRIYGELAGREIRTVDDLSDALVRGEIHPSQIPVDFVDIDGTRLILNTRTSTALRDAEVPRSDWFGRDQTGQVAIPKYGTTFDDLARNQLSDPRNAKYVVPGQVGWPELLVPQVR